MVHSIWSVGQSLNPKRLQEAYNDAIFYRDQIRALFTHGVVTLRERALGEKIYWHLVSRIVHEAQKLDHMPEDLSDVANNLTDFYYGNFSVFQSLPDAWAINQLFPVMPIHRLSEEPTRRAVLVDITCDCDGRLDRFIDLEDVKSHLPVHVRGPREPYYIGVFLVGAYQETLGDLHNLLGDPNVVSVGLKDGQIHFTHEVEGDSVADVLSYVEYEPKDLEARFRQFAENAVTAGKITPGDRKSIVEAYRTGLQGYTYYED